MDLRRRAVVADDYDTWKRVVGVYWGSRIPFALGVRRYQAATASLFERDLASLPRVGAAVYYEPPRTHRLSLPEIRNVLDRSRDNVLGIPQPGANELERLFETFAPAYTIDELDENDRIGSIELAPDGAARVDTNRPVVYRRLAHTRYGDEVLLQLVYSVWFPSRPKTGISDLLGGHLDGITWRVTLGRDGRPMLYDAIHNCGCYQQFFPTLRVKLKPQRPSLDEQAFVPQTVTDAASEAGVVLRVASRTHYIERVLMRESSVSGGKVYVFADDDTLRSLPVSHSERRSLFRPDGIIASSRRAERWLFWPMGVREPGAMRQWGRHATAFIGRRHFDDPHLIERYFERIE
jgi:hypothetical protein